MLKGLTFLQSVAVAAVLALPAVAETAPGPETVVARINGEEITLAHVIIAHATLPQQYQQLEADVLYEAILSQLIQQTALKQSFTGEVPKIIEWQLENELRSLLAGEAIEGIMLDAASDADIQAAYDAKFSQGFGGDEFNASHILVETEEEAKAIKADLDAGADFAATAKEKSTGPSGPNGGELGWFGLGAMVPEFEVAVVTLKPGEISQPVQTQFGWHVIILTETRKSEAPTLDDVREEISQQLRRDAVEARVEELTAAATVERPEIEGLKPEIIKNLDMIRN